MILLGSLLTALFVATMVHGAFVNKRTPVLNPCLELPVNYVALRVKNTTDEAQVGK